MRNGRGKSRATIGVARSRKPISLREESTGKRQIKDLEGSNNAKSFLKLEHLQKLAVWASGEASIPPLAAFFGNQLAATADSLGVSPGSSLFPCQRCETVLQPGINCTIRPEMKKSKAERQSIKHKDLVQNNVVYTCHFCSHRNLKKGNPRAHVKVCVSKDKTPSKTKLNVIEKSPSKQIRIEGEEQRRQESANTTKEVSLISDSSVCISKDRTPSESISNFIQKSQSDEIGIQGEEKAGQGRDLASMATKEMALIVDSPLCLAKDRMAESKQSFFQNSRSKEIQIEGEVNIEKEGDLTAYTTKEVALIAGSPITPVMKIGRTLLDGKRKRNRSSTKKQNDPKSVFPQTDRDDVDCSTVKRRRKPWTSLKEVAQAKNKQTM